MVKTLPSFIVYNKDKKDFTVFTTDISHASKATYTAKATIQVPTDHTMTDNVQVSTELSFELEVVAGCDVTEFVNWPLQSD